ncbi:MAG: outer membrane beta-barrel protein [Proteobacteria bacterium]|nr:outer membrane beta-barrel protein [Pseudomonadota bacterium]
MAMQLKLSGLCRALLVAVSVTASAGTAHAQNGNDLDALSQQILDNPTDASLNLRYARAAEAAGKPRLALAAYERILINDPNNLEAHNGYERVRRIIEPGYTVTRLEVGVRWDSDPLNRNPDFSFFGAHDAAATYYGRLMVANESQFVDHRWRSILNVDVEQTPDIHELNYEYVGAQTGPILYVGPHTAVLPAIGVATSWFGDEHYFNETNLTLGMEGRGGGASYWWRARYGYRWFDHATSSFFDPVTEDGDYFEIVGGYSRPHTFLERGTLTISPFVRWSMFDGDVFDFFTFDVMAPGKYSEFGADVNYNYQLSDHVRASVGALMRQRNFTGSVRSDTYFSPQASITLQDVLPCTCDLRLQYRYRDNNSNELLSDYHADQVSLALTTRF